MTTKTQDIQTPKSAALEPCANCGTPLAADQRYCLNCGDRRAGVRLDFMDILSVDAAERASANTAPAVIAARAAEKGGAEGWVRSHAGVLALSGVLLVTLFGGLAIGNWIHGDSGSPAASKPQVIKVDGAAGSSSTDDSASTGDSDSGSSADASAEKGGSGSTKGVQSADSKSSKDIEKSVDKGEPLSTGDGAAAKDDGKPAGGGSDFETIQ